MILVACLRNLTIILLFERLLGTDDIHKYMLNRYFEMLPLPIIVDLIIPFSKLFAALISGSVSSL